jgi:photosystem II stability/assembly factor-like uncharacterized protein
MRITEVLRVFEGVLRAESRERTVHLRTWTVLLSACSAIAQAANPVYVGASYGLYKSADAGATWSGVNIPLNNPLLRGPVSVYSLSMDPRDPAKVYFIGNATAWAFFASPDAGQTWSAAAFVGLVPNRVGVDFAGKIIYVTGNVNNGDYFLYKSADVGATWTRLKLLNTSTTPASRYPMGSPVKFWAADPALSGTIYASNGIEYFKSIDFGETWVLISSGVGAPATSVLGTYIDPRNPLTWYAGADHSTVSACPLTNGGMCGLFKSTNSGSTWTGLSIPSAYVSSISFGANSGTVYATAEVSGLGGAVMKTTDGGNTWTPLKTGLFTPRSGKVWADPSDPATIYTNDTFAARAFYASTDGGANFAGAWFTPRVWRRGRACPRLRRRSHRDWPCRTFWSGRTRSDGE